ncbi:MAG TPA: alpha/beta hydrolase family protein [Tepidisphaeraceae bacterium]|jgi:S-formylglutathione hydrolase FrmB|nr:alpha/beta hydrolase family protein [Tepidisphaeraceae bacterium]
MALINFRWFSRVLQKQVETQVLLPEHRPERCATFYLLHGLSDDSTMWLRRTRIEMDIDGLPLIVVMPDGGRGFYTDHEQGPKYGQHIGQELVDVIDRVFPTIASRDKRCIGGLSMGGYGALRTALAYPDRFVSANSHSGAVLAGTKGFDEGNAEFHRIFGATPSGANHDLLHLARRASAAGNLPQLLIDCGVDDFLYADNVKFIAGLKEAGVQHTYREFPGAHNWDYWNEHVREAVAFHCSAMGIRRDA